jgi:hypothetical protein
MSFPEERRKLDMKNLTRIAVSAGASWLWFAAAAAAQVLTPASLVPCAFSLNEVATAMGFQVEISDKADMIIPVGRDVGCLYSIKGSDFVFGVRQTWDSTRTVASPTPVGSSDATGGQVVYVVGKVQITVFWHGGNLAATDGLARLLLLRRLP